MPQVPDKFGCVMWYNTGLCYLGINSLQATGSEQSGSLHTYVGRCQMSPGNQQSTVT